MKDKVILTTKEIGHLLILFLIGAFAYMGIEIGFRGFTHWTMGVLGGLCFIIIGELNEHNTTNLSFLNQCICGSLIITSLEFVAGVILNMILGLNIWDYSNMPFNIYGQICLPFTIAWFFLSGVAILLDDFIRHILFKEEMPKYKWI